MADISCFRGILIILILKEQPKNPSKLLAVPNFIRLKTKYTYSKNLKSTKISLVLILTLSETIQFILSYRKMFVSLLTKEKSQLMCVGLLIQEC